MAAADLLDQLRAGVLQTGRLLKIDTPLGRNTLLVQRVVGQSRVGRDYDFTADVASLSESIELKQLIAQPVTLWLQQGDKSYRPVHGYVHTARRLGSDGGLTSYQLGFACWMHFLRFRKDARIWQDTTVDDIVTQVFNEHPQAKGAFRFALDKPLAPRSFCVQYESDWNFVHRLMETEGWYGFYEQADDGQSHTLVITDNLDAFKPLSPQTVSFYRAGTNSETDAFVQWSGTRTLQSSTVSTSTFDYKAPRAKKTTEIPAVPEQGNLPEQAEVYEYTGAYAYKEQERGDSLSKIRMEEFESRAKRYVGVGAVRNVDAGRWFELADHPELSSESEQNRQFAVLSAQWVIENNLPVSNSKVTFPHSLQQRVSAVRAEYGTSDPYGVVDEGDGSTGFFLTTIEAQRRTVPFRSPLEHAKPVMPTQTATVVGPSGEEIYTDELNRIKVHMHWDRLNHGDENASCWVRVSYPNAGDNWGGVFVPRIGQEVVITYVDGDPDRPLVTGRVYNGAAQPQWHSNGQLSGYKSKEHKGGGFNQLVFDDTTSQNRVHLYSTQTAAQLNLGYLVSQQDNTRGAFRGSGFELASDAYGAIRTQKGLYISTFGRAGASGDQLDVKEAFGQLQAGQQLLGALSDTGAQHGADAMQANDTLKSFTAATQGAQDGASGASGASGGSASGAGTGNANGFSDPVLLLASPKGVGIATPASVHVHAGENATVSAGKDVNIGVGKGFVLNAVERVSVLALKLGMKLIAARGKVQIQAQQDGVDLLALKGIQVTSTTDSIQLTAQKDILLTSGGAYIRLTGGNIQIHAPGAVDIKGAQHSFSGPTRYDGQPQALPQGIVNDQQFVLKDEKTGNVMPLAPYRIENANGDVLARGITDAEGKTVRVFTGSKAQSLNMFHEDDGV
ncbi:type VI secretion system Vgr family protein [Paraburkholderia sp. J41]|uniref:type VI secretion system Vgr family protein n=1 Tax=Paraburkholderia sp. J41 TaxID=2805433 RepID=UPI002AC3225A|nr:type VI secretion system Vgr family protein [Paraburkholderia sp. J41]